MSKYIKKSIIVDAEIYKKGLEDGFEFYKIDGSFVCYMTTEEMKRGYPRTNRIPVIETLEGRKKISDGDYIITGVNDERYICKSDIFHMNYKPMDVNSINI